MADLPLEELLSAYLDGELTADEQARAERLLALDPQAQRLLDDLRSVSGHVQSLPKQSLPPTFSQQVLRHAERQMLSHDAVIPLAEANLPAVDETSPPPEPWSERIRRPLLYAMLAACVAILLALFDPNPADQRAPTGGVALAPESETEPIAPASAASDAVAPSNGARGPDMAAPGFSNASAPPAEMDAAKSPASGDAAQVVPAAPERRLSTVLKSAETTSLPREPSSKAGQYSASMPLDGLLVVECTVSPAALKNESFQKLLSRQQMQWKYAEVADNVPQSLMDRVEPSRPASEPATQTAGVAPDVKLLYVEATAEQMEETLAELSARPESFPTVMVDPVVSAGAQQRWQSQYNRTLPQFAAELPMPAEKAGESATASSSDKQSVAKNLVDEPKAKELAKPTPKASKAAPKEGVPARQQLENTLGNTSRARSYSVPRQAYEAKPNAANTPGEGMAQEPAADSQARQQTAGKAGASANQAAGENRLRALFVLQISPEAAVESTSSIAPAEAPPRAAPAKTAPSDAPDAEKR